MSITNIASTLRLRYGVGEQAMSEQAPAFVRQTRAILKMGLLLLSKGGVHHDQNLTFAGYGRGIRQLLNDNARILRALGRAKDNPRMEACSGRITVEIRSRRLDVLLVSYLEILMAERAADNNCAHSFSAIGNRSPGSFFAIRQPWSWLHS